MARIPLLIGATAIVLGSALLSAPVEAEPSSAAVPDQDRAKRAKCKGKVATIVGNRRNNKLEGTPRRDVIVGRGGGDVIIGRGGNDIICGGGGGDVITGLNGRDTLYGGSKKDQCFGERREHRRHFGCEVHRNPLGAPVRHPHAPHRSAASEAIPVPAADVPADIARRRGVATSDRPYCQDGVVNLGRFYFTADYTNPGWIAVRPVFAQWNEFGGGYGGDVAATDWQLYNAPADGQYYQVPMGSFNFFPGISVWGYQVYWWNGAQWVDGQLIGIPRYDNAGASAAFTYSLGSCVT